VAAASTESLDGKAPLVTVSEVPSLSVKLT
jgi:hypothetical protein